MGEEWKGLEILAAIRGDSIKHCCLILTRISFFFFGNVGVNVENIKNLLFNFKSIFHLPVYSRHRRL